MIGEQSGLVAAVYLALLLIGIGYNLLVAWMERSGYMHGFTALVVVGGVLITLAGVAILARDDDAA